MGLTERGRYWLRLLLTALILGALLYTQRNRLGRLGGALTDVDPLLFTTAWALNGLGSILLPAVMTWIALGHGRVRLRFRTLVRINLITRFYSMVVPQGGVLAIRWNLYRAGGWAGDAFALVVFERLLLFFFFILGSLVFLVLELDRLPAGMDAALLPLGLVVIGWLLLIVPFFSPTVHALLLRTVSPVRRRLPAWVSTKLERLTSAVAEYHTLSDRRYWSIGATSLGGYLCMVLSAVILAQAMGLVLSWLAVAWTRSLVTALTRVPITVAGLGVREAGYVALLGLYDVPAPEALAFGLLLFAIQIILAVIGAVLNLWGIRDSEAEVAAQFDA